MFLYALGAYVHIFLLTKSCKQNANRSIRHGPTMNFLRDRLEIFHYNRAKSRLRPSQTALLIPPPKYIRILIHISPSECQIRRHDVQTVNLPTSCVIKIVCSCKYNNNEFDIPGRIVTKSSRTFANYARTDTVSAKFFIPTSRPFGVESIFLIKFFLRFMIEE